MTKNKLLLIFLSFLFISISAYGLNKYLILKNETDSPISYHFISAQINSSARGNSYYVLVSYLGNEHKVAITSRNYRDLDRKRSVKLYYSPGMKQVFSMWELEQNLRIGIIFMLSAIVCGSLVFVRCKLVIVKGRNRNN